MKMGGHFHKMDRKCQMSDCYNMPCSSGNSLPDDVSSVAESEPLSLADQSFAGSENWEGSDISVGKEDCKSVEVTQSPPPPQKNRSTPLISIIFCKKIM